jgi:hypothetical protein
MDIANSWRKTASHLWVRGDYLIWGGDSPPGYYWGVSVRSMALDIGPLREGPFPDFLSCAVACELATGGRTDEQLRV